MVKEWTPTPEQQEVIDLDSGQHLVLAPPGTGKTEILALRLLKAIESGIEQEKIACLTFTNRAAKQMIDRAKEKKIGENKAFIGNIHSFCSKFLRKHDIIPQISSLLDEEDVDQLIEELMKELVYEEVRSDANGNDYIETVDNRPEIGKRDHGYVTDKMNTEELLKYNSYLKQRACGFDEAICEVIDFQFGHYYCYSEEESKKYNLRQFELDERALELEKIHTQRAQELCEKYEAIKTESDFMDFDDLLILTCDYLNKNPLSSGNLKQWIQLDEAQDINPLQWAIINQISNKENSHRVFFGDREQAIFSFMGSSLKNLERIEKDCRSHYFSINHRSPQYLLDLYVKYAEDVLGIHWPKKPVARQTQEKPVDALQFVHFETVYKQEHRYAKVEVDYANQFVEADSIVRSIYQSRKDGGNCAILLHTNKQADLYGNTFKHFYPDLAIFKISGRDLFSLRITKDLMAVLAVIVDDRNKVAWIRNLAVFGGETLKASRPIINQLFDSGINPIDFVRKEEFKESYLDDFLDIYTNERVVVFDTETTGLNEDRQDDIIQIAAREVINGKLGKTFDAYIDTDLDFSEAQEVHHISKETLENDGIDRKVALQDFLNFVGNDALIAHNLRFDYKVLNDNLLQAELPPIPKKITCYYDSMEIVKRLRTRLPRYKLECLLNEFNLEGENTHNAIDDVDATVSLIQHCASQIKSSKSSRMEWRGDTGTVKLIDKFRERFLPLYEALEGKFSDEMALVDILDMITFYIDDRINPQSRKYEEEHVEELDKLRFHMNKSSNGKPIFGIAEKIMQDNIHEYMKYKEADLFLEDENRITIATVYKAKGLEFDTVYIPLCHDENYPFIYSQNKEISHEQEAATLEEARLLYVAMTRAKKRLVISYADHFFRFQKRPSRFLNNIVHMFDNITIKATERFKVITPSVDQSSRGSNIE